MSELRAPMHIFTSLPIADHLPAGLILLQDAFGYNRYLLSVAQRFADLGFTVVVPELFHRTGGVGIEFDDPRGMEANREHMRALTVENVLLDVQDAYEWLRATDAFPPERIAVIGWCRGGQGAFFANAHLPLGAAISMYGNRIAPDLLEHAKTQHGRILTIWGGADKYIPTEERRAVVDALSAAGKAHDDVVFSDADHGFFSPHAYHEGAARMAWSVSVEFLRATGVLIPTEEEPAS
jgi:carboxymethylenebutenolidase